MDKTNDKQIILHIPNNELFLKIIIYSHASGSNVSDMINNTLEAKFRKTNFNELISKYSDDLNWFDIFSEIMRSGYYE